MVRNETGAIVPEVWIKEPLAGLVAKVIARLNGGTVPDAFTIGDDTIYLVVPDDSLRRHEAVHRAQAKRFEPWWIPAFGPLRGIRESVGQTRFIIAYIAEHRRVGYGSNRYEVEARAAE